MKFLLVAAFAGVALAQKGSRASAATAASTGAPTTRGKGKNANTGPTTAPTPAPTASSGPLPLYLSLPMEPGQIWNGSAWVFPPSSSTTTTTQQFATPTQITTVSTTTTTTTEQSTTQQPAASNTQQSNAQFSTQQQPQFSTQQQQPQFSTQQQSTQQQQQFSAQQPQFYQQDWQQQYYSQAVQPQLVQIVNSSVSTSSGPQISIEQDTSCSNAGVGALWCAAKRKCLRAWEEPCPQFGEDTETHVQVKSPGPAAPIVPVVVTVPLQAPIYEPSRPTNRVPLYPGVDLLSTATLYPATSVSTASTPLYPTATPIYPVSRPIYPATTPIYPVSTPIYPVSTPIYPVSTPIYPVSTPIYPTTSAGFYTPRVVSTAGIYAPAQSASYGSDRDANGCISSAGYTYCVSLSRCVRPWETACPAAPVAAPLAAATSQTAPAPVAIGGQRDAGGCVTGGGYSFCPSLNRCVRVWETPCPA